MWRQCPCSGADEAPRIPNPFPPESEQARWFAEHVLPHEPMLRAWLRSKFTSEVDHDDIVQEAFLRLLQAREEDKLESPKAFLFAIARNLAVDRMRRRQVARAEPLASEVVDLFFDDGVDVAETVARNQELELLTEAIQSLPDRCRQVFTLRKVYGLSQSEIAKTLGISEHTASAQLTIGLHKCTAYLARYRAEQKGAGI